MKVSRTKVALSKGLMEPVEQVGPMNTLDMAASIADGDWAMLLLLESGNVLHPGRGRQA